MFDIVVELDWIDFVEQDLVSKCFCMNEEFIKIEIIVIEILPRLKSRHKRFLVSTYILVR